MRYLRRPGRTTYTVLRLSRRQRTAVALLALASAFTAMLIPASRYLQRVSTEMALSDASDMVTLAVSETVRMLLAEGSYSYDSFVRLERDAGGRVSAIVTDMSGINRFSSIVLERVVSAADSGRLDIRVPLGNLMGLNTLLGRGPKIPVEIIMLTSSRTEFKNELISAGINQTKHQIKLIVTVYIDVLIPWATASDEIVCEVLIAETVIVGDVPEAYIEYGG